SLVGNWRMAGHVMKDSVYYRAKGRWILNHQFFHFAMKDVNRPSRYEAHVFWGYDSSKTNYVVHWLDVFGGESSKTLGSGRVNSDSIQILFDYPGRPFRDFIRLWKNRRGGQFLIEYQTADGEWKEFANYKMEKVSRKMR
ncbi:MAG: hypothetical protein D6814_06300, partial [Calditrichaeota bacterium]